MSNVKRYVLQKLIDEDKDKHLKVWKNTTLSSEKYHELNNFLSKGYRIYDMENNKIVKVYRDHCKNNNAE
ncbi:hypothetical protein [Paenibacillus sp. Marseille-Q4541]|uniref:hypothetical protein n=1 Tax=Paenibacillus sp. Marseille-Q4541 TaxID=2831522 RepID=UPI001BA94F81|nr:hypothetical protein [Paenibacillus sp. Marseille-Q4541]